MDNKKEISQEELDSICGGIMSAKDLEATVDIIKAYRDNGHPKEDLYNLIRGFADLCGNNNISTSSSFTVDEFVEFCEKNWDTV